MATVKTIDVAVRGNTEQFQAELLRGSQAVTKFSSEVGATTGTISSSLSNLDRQASSIATTMGRVASAFQQGGLTPQEYSAAIGRLTRDLEANAAGFGNMRGAVARADSILKSTENSTEGFQNQLRELEQLFKVGALGPERYSESVKRMTDSFMSAIPAIKSLETSTDRYRASVRELNQTRMAMRAAGLAKEEEQLGLAIRRTKDAFAASTKSSAQDLRARAAGFDSMASAVQRADSIIKSTATDTERLSAKQAELARLTKLGTLSIEQEARALATLNPSAYGAATAMKSLGSRGSMISGIKFGGFANQLTLVSQAASQLNIVSPGIGNLTASLGSLARLGGPLAAVGASIAGIALGLRNAMKETQRVGDISMELGIDPQELLGLEHAAKMTGTSIDTLQSGLQRLTVHGAEAAAGNKAMIDVFDRLGIDAKKFNQIPLDDKFRVVAEAMANIENPAERARVAVQLFGKEGIALTSVLNLGAAGLDAATAKTILYGNTVTQNGIGAVSAWQEATASLSLAWDGFSQSLLNTVAPAVNFIAGAIEKATTVFLFLKKAAVGDTYGASIVAGWEKAPPVIDAVNTKLKDVAATTSKAQQQIDEWKAKAREQDLKLEVKVQEDAADKFKSFMDGLKSNIGQIEESLAKALTPQEKFLRQIQAINHAYDLSLITLEKRNELLIGTQNLANKPAQDERLKRFQEDQNRMQQAGKSITDSVKSPLESFADKVAELQKLQRRGFITPETFNRAFATARKEFGESLKTEFKPTEVKGPAALEAGSQAAFSAFQQASRDANKSNAQVEEQKKTNQKLDQLVRKGVVLAAAKW